MFGAIAGPLISAGASLLGGFFGQKSEAKLQKQFAKNAIQWKVRDSLKAGIHPLFGLGANTTQYAPTNILGDSIARAGQDIGTAVDRMRTPDQRASSLEHKILANQVTRGDLENQLLASQLARQAQTPTPSPPSVSGDTYVIPGQGDTRVPGGMVQGGGRRLPVGLPVIGAIDPPNPSESPAQDIEGEYGEWASDGIGAVRFARDATAKVQAYLANEWQKALRNQPNAIFYVKRRKDQSRIPQGYRARHLTGGR